MLPHIFRSFIILLIFGIVPMSLFNIEAAAQADMGRSIEKDKVRKVGTIRKPDTIASVPNFLSRIEDIAVLSKNKVVIADNQNYVLRVLDIKSGEEVMQVGRKGKGPGEFEIINRVKVLRNDGFFVIDNALMRITEFDLNGSVKRTIQLTRKVGDFLFLDDFTMLFSAFEFKRDFKPLKVYSQNNRLIIDEFGTIVEPQEGIFREVEKAREVRMGSYDMFDCQTKLTAVPDTNWVYFSQRNPYRIVRYQLHNAYQIEFNTEVPFSTDSNRRIQIRSIDGKEVVRKGFGIEGGVVCLQSYKGYVVAVVVNKDLSLSYIDVFDRYGTLKKRMQIPVEIPNERVACKTAVIGDDDVLYMLLYDFRDFISWIEVFSFSL